MSRLFISLVAVLFLLSGFGCSSLGGNIRPSDDPALEARYDDAGVKTAITTSLLKQSPSSANDVGVYCFNGQVYLVGEAGKGFREFAVETARTTKGVVHVTTHWFQPGTGSSLDDITLESSLNAKLREAAGEVSRVAVEAVGGHVVVMGVLKDSQEISRIEKALKDVSGVKSVTSYLVAG